MSKFIISRPSISQEDLYKEESIFSLANGKIGIRGGLEEDYLLGGSYDNHTYMYGFFEKEPIIYGESAYGYAKNHQTIAPVPSGHGFALIIDGETVTSQEGNLLSHHREFNMEEGTLQRDLIWESKTGKRVKIQVTRQIIQTLGSPVDYVCLYSVSPINFTGNIEIQSYYGIKQVVKDKVVPNHDPRKKDTFATTVSYYYEVEHNRIKFTGEAKNSKRKMQAIFDEFTNWKAQSHDVKEATYLIRKYRFEAQKGVTYTIKGVGYYSLDTIEDWEYDLDEVVKQHQITMKDFWKKSLIEIEGDDELGAAIIFNLYQLYQSAGRTPQVNMGAKGLSGAGYEGHYFWDTEMYMIHQFMYTQPEIAKSLLLYRHSILPKARQRAREMGLKKGALFPWRTIDGEEASAYYPAGTAQVHINADIAHSVYEYYRVSQDKQFMEEAGIDILVETARFWVEFGAYLDGKFVINGVTGPDEYTAIVNNNYYTNKMAQANLRYAAELVKKFDYELENQEISSWIDAAEKMKLGYCAKRQLTKQDDTIFEKNVWDFDHTPKDRYPLLLHYHPMMIYRCQVNKQADTVLAHYLFFDDEKVEQIARDYDYYEAITTHDSSLSKSIFSIVAALLGNKDKAYHYFMETVYMDLLDGQGNVVDGIHAANMGGMWLSLIKGFAGFRYIGTTPSITNHLPQQWNKLKFNLRLGSSLVKVVLTPDKTSVSLEEGPSVNLWVDGKGVYLEGD